ncbi:MAG: bifunctional 5,10-methylenetetrahydrofolate dehydrogenase/5,10-methenyltetrahydrofolate cyclohydrolase [Patescibacteria group bacterium]
MPLIDGTALARRIREQVKQDVTALAIKPRLEVLLVGEDTASHLYVSLKKKAGNALGIEVDVHHLPEETSDEELLALIETWNQDATVHGILIQIPLPEGHDEDRLIRAVDPKKDVDGFHPDNIQALMSGEPQIIPPVHEGILRLINETPLKLPGASAVIIVNSDIFAAPLKRLLTTAGMFVEVVKPDAIKADGLKEADVIVIAIGRLNFLRPDMVKEGCVIIDVGTNKTADGKTRGDANTEAFLYDQPTTWISPVPGGVGPMTVAQLMKTTARLATASAQQTT